MRPSASILVDFSGPGSDGGLFLALDKEKIRSVYGEDKSSFIPGEAAYLRLFSMPDTPYYLHSSAGSLSVVAREVPYPQEENIVFSWEAERDLSFVPDSSVDWKWMGRSAGNPLFAGTKITLPEIEVEDGAPEQKPVGVLNCKYTVMGDRLKLFVPASAMSGFESIEVNVVAVQGQNVASLTVAYSTGLYGEPVPVDLSVSDFCSNEHVWDVMVFIDGEYMGKTNANGTIYLGMMAPGSIHQLKMTREGYIDSDLDVLHNDSFTVPKTAS